MLRRQDHGPIVFWEMARSLGSRTLITTGVYVVDGLLVDTGPANARAELRRVLDDSPVTRVVLTHEHEDHVGNAAFVAQHTGCVPLAHPEAVAAIRDAPRLPMYRRVAWGVPDPVEATALGEELATDKYRFLVVPTPGHAQGHVALHEPEQGWLFVGDLFLDERVRWAFAYEDIPTMIESLRTLLAIPDCEMFCQHSGPQDGHQHRLGRKLDFILGTQQQAVVLFEEGRSVAEITRALGIREGWFRWFSGGEISGRNLVEKLLRDAGKDPDE